MSPLLSVPATLWRLSAHADRDALPPGRVLHDLRVVDTLIGPEPAETVRVVITEGTPTGAPERGVTAIPLRPAKKQAQLVLGAIVRIAPHIPVDETPGRTEIDDLPGGGIHPTREQAERYFESGRGREPLMLNFLTYRDAAAYQRYWKVAMRYVYRGGGGLMLSASVRRDPEGKRAWDSVALVRYARRSAFRHMVTRKAYQDATRHRDEGLARTELLVCEPW